MFYIALGVLIDRIRHSWKQHFWTRLSKFELVVTSFWMFLRRNKFWLSPLDWNVDKLTKRKGSIIVLSLSILNWLVSKAIGLNSFGKVAIKMFLVKFGVCVIMVCCLLDQFFIRHIDGKYGSATGTLVWSLTQEIAIYGISLLLCSLIHHFSVYRNSFLFWWMNARSRLILFVRLFCSE